MMMMMMMMTGRWVYNREGLYWGSGEGGGLSERHIFSVDWLVGL